MDDLISRQAALYAIYEICNEPVAWLMRAAREIEKLPSSQPEIIHCRECKHWEQESICDGYCNEIEKDGFDEDHFCGYAERREE